MNTSSNTTDSGMFGKWMNKLVGDSEPVCYDHGEEVQAQQMLLWKDECGPEYAAICPNSGCCTSVDPNVATLKMNCDACECDMDPTASSIISMVLFFIMVGAQARTEPGLSKLVVMLWARWLISRCCLCSVQIIMAVTLTYMCCARACRRTRVQRTTVVMEAQPLLISTSVDPAAEKLAREAARP
mmetsp:Transcript_12207/g.44533  ORF Transcript_12207/g.44533 Transcript_12207/m.44533 type:complete len:185 (-) Transcript_12207:259-813(-)